MPNRPQVLVIDDDRTMREIASAALRNAGYRVQVAEDALQGFMVARRQGPDVILLDLRMPGGGGEQVWRRLKACRNTEGIPIVVVTGVEPGGRTSQFLTGTQVSVLQKPVSPDDLVAAVWSSVPVN
ncbi:MAG TPA: response regulator [Gemmatimonadales bacterium]|nr:response regulator [Gemmatimonadales bacterium]